MSFFELVQHQVFHIVPEAVFHHIVDAFVTEDGEFVVFDGQIDEHAVAPLRFVEFQFVENEQAALFHIAFAAVLDMYLNLTRGVALGLSDGFHNALVFFSVQYGYGV